MLEQQKVEELTNNLSKYINTNYELIKLEAADQASELISSMISGIILGVVGFLFILFVSFGLGYFLSAMLEKTYLGFELVAGFYLLLGIILILSRKKMIEKPLRNKMIRKMLYKNNSQTN